MPPAAPSPSDPSCERSARRRGAGRRRRRSRDEEEQDGTKVVFADIPPSAGDPPAVRRGRWEEEPWRVAIGGGSMFMLIVP